MNNASLAAGACALAFCTALFAHDDRQFPADATFSTLAITPFAIEGLTADRDGNFYSTGRAPTGTPCPVWRFTGPALTVVGLIPNPAACNPSGIAFDAHGDLYVADAASGGIVWRFTPNADVPPTATAFATGVPGTNGLAFDRDGNLWTGDGTTGQGRVWKISPAGGACEPAFTDCMEAFRIQPMANAAGVGRSNSTTQPGGTPAPNPQPLVANGLAFTHSGDLYVADTARGAVWKIELDRDGNLKSRTGCDTTFLPNTLCLENVFVAHPALEGTDGIALDRAGNIWNSANERNAIVVVTKDRRVIEIFRNPVVSGLRNAGPLELPTSPVLSGKRFCTANSDGNRRDNSPNSAGEVNQGGPVGARGKVACMEQALEIPGLPLPVR